MLRKILLFLLSAFSIFFLFKGTLSLLRLEFTPKYNFSYDSAVQTFSPVRINLPSFLASDCYYEFFLGGGISENEFNIFKDKIYAITKVVMLQGGNEINLPIQELASYSKNYPSKLAGLKIPDCREEKQVLITFSNTFKPDEILRAKGSFYLQNQPGEIIQWMPLGIIYSFLFALAFLFAALALSFSLRRKSKERNTKTIILLLISGLIFILALTRFSI